MFTGKFWAIGVGPGDPELITLKARRLLASAQVIYHAGPTDAEGFALDIVRAWLSPGQSVRGLQTAMVRGDGDGDWRARYRAAAQRIAADCRQGKNVAFITEGDPALYSTAGYLHQLLGEEHPGVPREMVPGVTSISAAAARGGMALVRKDQTLALLSGLYGRHSLSAALRDFDSAAILKLGEAWPGLLESIPQDRPLLYAEALGTAAEFVTADRTAMAGRSAPYFSLLLVGPEEETAREKGGKLKMIGLGPGDAGQMTLAAHEGLHWADAFVGYAGYLDLLDALGLEAERFPSPLGDESARADLALELARAGRRVALVSSGDAGVFGMASVLLERSAGDVEIEIIAGVTAALSSAALLGAPLGHDFACISLSDLLTPWERIEARLKAAAAADFVVVLYNPASQRRNWQLARAAELLREHRPPQTPVGLVDHAYRPGQTVRLATLDSLQAEQAAMTTTVVIGNSQTFVRHGKMITPRGYPAR